VISAILLDAGGVLVLPQPDVMLPPLRAAGILPDLATLERAHYRAMSLLDIPGTPDPGQDTWWHSYLLDYVTECGIGVAEREAVAARMSREIRGFGWTHVPEGARDGLRAIAALGIPMGIVSNSNGSVQDDLRRLGVCNAGDSQSSAGCVEVGVVIDSHVVGVAKPDPEIFRIALQALGIPASQEVIHVGDSLRYDVTGAFAAGLRPLHLDPHGYCPIPEGHEHITSLNDIPEIIQEHSG
jgi:putative hydrolase of the HAD superfamily